MMAGFGIALSLPATATAGDGTFPESGHTTVPITADPRSIALGDFDNDGNYDFAAATETDVSVRLGDGAGGFPKAGVVPGHNDSIYTGVAVADFNKDGNEDLAVPSSLGTAPNKLGIKLGNGTGNFIAGPTLTTGDRPLAVATGDFNGDGSEDVVAANLGAGDNDPGSLSIHQGNGDGTFVTPHVTIGTAVSPREITVGDLNGDGDLDLVVGTRQIAQIFLGGANTGFTSPGGIAAGSSVQGIALGDFNGDGNTDIAAASTASITVGLGGPNGTFPGTAVTTQGAQSPVDIAVGDFNSDGREDLAWTSQSRHLKVRLGAGDGTFPSALEATVPTDGRALGLVIGDFNADGNEDLAATGDPGGLGEVSVHLGGGPSSLAGSLLTNGGFEGASAVREPDTSPPPPITGWQRTGSITAARYGMWFSSIFPTHVDSPRFLTGGLNYLYGGVGPGPGTSSALQTVEVSIAASSIDAGLASADLSAYLGAGNVFDDQMSATASFLDGAGTELGALAIGPVSAAERKTRTTLLRRQGFATVPVGTRQIRVTLTATNIDAGGSSAFADNVKLTLDAPEPPPPDSTTPDTSIEFDLSARRAQRVVKQRGVIVTLLCPQEGCMSNSTASTRVPNPRGGRSSLVRLRLRPIIEPLDAGVPERVKLALKRKQLGLLKAALATGRKPRVRVNATVTDAAGNAATETLVVSARR